mmetsp:Transcript_25269/g.58201  ORF Transcript_25269/g.58201 Transcript_25269/m.58201 type:complete len:199 (-) Transcript_25269:36-632(-)
MPSTQAAEQAQIKRVWALVPDQSLHEQLTQQVWEMTDEMRWVALRQQLRGLDEYTGASLLGLSKVRREEVLTKVVETLTLLCYSTESGYSRTAGALLNGLSRGMPGEKKQIGTDPPGNVTRPNRFPPPAITSDLTGKESENKKMCKKVEGLPGHPPSRSHSKTPFNIPGLLSLWKGVEPLVKTARRIPVHSNDQRASN